MDEEKILDVIIDIGMGILVSGGEVFRVEDSVKRMLFSYGVEKADVFAITSAITVTIHLSDGRIYTNTRRINRTEINLKRLDMLNSLSRFICENKPGHAEVRKKLERIMVYEEYSPVVKNISYAMVSFSFCRINDGNFAESIIAGVLGIVLINAVKMLEKIEVNKLVSLIGASFLCGMLGRFGAFVFSVDAAKIAVGNIMLLVPGLTVTNALRDLITGDTMAGILHLCDGILIATCLVLGFVLADSV